jgi:uncharacterized protein (DUF58 family)
MIAPELMAAIRRIEIRSNRVVDSMVAGEYHSAFKGQGLNFAEVREYAVGDDVRQIDWNVTARSGKPHIKLFNEERELTVVIAADLSGSGDFGSVDQTKREMIAEITAVLGLAAMKNNDRVGAVLFTDQVETHIPVKKGRSHVLRLIRDVLAVTPKSKGTSLDMALRFISKTQRRSAIVFLISDFLDSGFEKALGLASVAHDVVPIVIRDPKEAALPNAGWLRLIDPETRQTVILNSGNAKVRQAYAENVAAKDQQLLRLFHRLNLLPIQVQVGQPYINPLVRFFAARGHW